MNEQITRALNDLPRGWEIVITLGKDWGDVNLFDPTGNEVEWGLDPDADYEYDLSNYISRAIDAARAKEKS